MLAELAGGDGQMSAEGAAQALGTAEAETLRHDIDLFVTRRQGLARAVDPRGRQEAAAEASIGAGGVAGRCGDAWLSPFRAELREGADRSQRSC